MACLPACLESLPACLGSFCPSLGTNGIMQTSCLSALKFRLLSLGAEPFLKALLNFFFSSSGGEGEARPRDVAVV